MHDTSKQAPGAGRRQLQRTSLAVVAAIVASGCGRVDPDAEPTPDAAATIDAPVADAPPSVDALVVVDRNCVEVKARLGTATDGVYWIDPDRDGASYKPFQVFCAAMATATPREYLELRRTSPPGEAPSSNYSTYAMGVVHAAWTCDCGVATTVYSKIRIDPVTLVVGVFDTTYAVYASSTQVSCLQTKPGCPGPTGYTIASACVTNFDASGRANVDLRDLGFHVAGTGTEMFTGAGFTPAGMAAIDADRKTVALTGGGDCGHFGAGGGLQLAQDF